MKITRDNVIMAAGILGAISAALTVTSLFDSPIERVKLGFLTATGSAIASTAYLAAGAGVVIGVGLATTGIYCVDETIKNARKEQQSC